MSDKGELVKPGVEVEVRGLQNNPALNGSRGRVIAFKEVPEGQAVVVHFGEEVMMLFPDNLSLIPDSGVEMRVDTEDGNFYTQQEFTDFYGPAGAAKWEGAPQFNGPHLYCPVLKGAKPKKAGAKAPKKPKAKEGKPKPKGKGARKASIAEKEDTEPDAGEEERKPVAKAKSRGKLKADDTAPPPPPMETVGETVVSEGEDEVDASQQQLPRKKSSVKRLKKKSTASASFKKPPAPVQEAQEGSAPGASAAEVPTSTVSGAPPPPPPAAAEEPVPPASAEPEKKEETPTEADTAPPPPPSPPAVADDPQADGGDAGGDAGAAAVAEAPESSGDHAAVGDEVPAGARDEGATRVVGRPPLPPLAKPEEATADRASAPSEAGSPRSPARAAGTPPASPQRPAEPPAVSPQDAAPPAFTAAVEDTQPLAAPAPPSPARAHPAESKNSNEPTSPGTKPVSPPTVTTTDTPKPTTEVSRERSAGPTAEETATASPPQAASTSALVTAPAPMSIPPPTPAVPPAANELAADGDPMPEAPSSAAPASSPPKPPAAPTPDVSIDVEPPPRVGKASPQRATPPSNRPLDPPSAIPRPRDTQLSRYESESAPPNSVVTLDTPPTAYGPHAPDVQPQLSQAPRVLGGAAQERAEEGPKTPPHREQRSGRSHKTPKGDRVGKRHVCIEGVRETSSVHIDTSTEHVHVPHTQHLGNTLADPLARRAFVAEGLERFYRKHNPKKADQAWGVSGRAMGGREGVLYRKLVQRYPEHIRDLKWLERVVNAGHIGAPAALSDDSSSIGSLSSGETVSDSEEDEEDRMLFNKYTSSPYHTAKRLAEEQRQNLVRGTTPKRQLQRAIEADLRRKDARLLEMIDTKAAAAMLLGAGCRPGTPVALQEARRGLGTRQHTAPSTPSRNAPTQPVSTLSTPPPSVHARARGDLHRDPGAHRSPFPDQRFLGHPAEACLPVSPPTLAGDASARYAPPGVIDLDTAAYDASDGSVDEEDLGELIAQLTYEDEMVRALASAAQRKKAAVDEMLQARRAKQQAVQEPAPPPPATPNAAAAYNTSHSSPESDPETRISPTHRRFSPDVRRYPPSVHTQPPVASPQDADRERANRVGGAWHDTNFDAGAEGPPTRTSAVQLQELLRRIEAEMPEETATPRETGRGFASPKIEHLETQLDTLLRQQHLIESRVGLPAPPVSPLYTPRDPAVPLFTPPTDAPLLAHTQPLPSAAGAGTRVRFPSTPDERCERDGEAAGLGARYAAPQESLGATVIRSPPSTHSATSTAFAHTPMSAALRMPPPPARGPFRDLISELRDENKRIEEQQQSLILQQQLQLAQLEEGVQQRGVQVAHDARGELFSRLQV